jgi:AcrR family transcriptional regulator
MAHAAERTRLSTTERREQLLLFGRAHFATSGFDADSMQAIAEAAGVSKGLLYHHFGGRRGFYLATVEHVIDGVIAAMSAPARQGFQHELLSMIEGFVTYARENAPIYKALVRGGLGADAEVAAQLDRVRRFATDRIVAVAGLAEPTPTDAIVLTGWISFVESATAQWLDEPRVDQAVFVELLVTTLAPALGRLFTEARA